MGINVLHINSHTTWRGGEQQVHSIFNGRYKNINTYLYCPEGSALAQKNDSFKDRVFTYKKRFGLDIPAAFGLKKICREKSIDLVHLHDSHAVNTYLAAVFFGLKVPCIIHRRVNFPVASGWKYRHKNILKIICISQEVKNTMMAVVPEDKLTVIYSGICLEKFTNNHTSHPLRQELNILPDKKIVGMVTSLEKEKNVEEFAVIALQLNSTRNDVVYVVIGGGSLLNSHTQHYPFINFLGFRSNVPELLQDLDVFVFTSHTEGLGTAVLEAMAAEVPVVCRNFPVAKEMIQDGKTGSIYTHAEDAVQKINSLLDDSATHQLFSQNARLFVQQFDVTLMNEQLETLYTSFIHKK
ncbi:MAG: glycosyltransferase family 4 protein [Chitinophagales bacterium]